MSTIYCEYDCKYSGKDGICTNEEVTMGPMGCNDFEEEPEPICPDKFYAFHKDFDKEYGSDFVWIEKLGIKGEFLGREIFLNGYDDNLFTDGRTGVAGAKKPLLEMSEEKRNNIFAELEERNGISPLYTDTPKYPIKPIKITEQN
jgi:hypothetical protein